jgi:hypothetical protein
MGCKRVFVDLKFAISFLHMCDSSVILIESFEIACAFSRRVAVCSANIGCWNMVLAGTDRLEVCRPHETSWWKAAPRRVFGCLLDFWLVGQSRVRAAMSGTGLALCPFPSSWSWEAWILGFYACLLRGWSSLLLFVQTVVDINFIRGRRGAQKISAKP